MYDVDHLLLWQPLVLDCHPGKPINDNCIIVNWLWAHFGAVLVTPASRKSHGWPARQKCSFIIVGDSCHVQCTCTCVWYKVRFIHVCLLLTLVAWKSPASRSKHFTTSPRLSKSVKIYMYIHVCLGTYIGVAYFNGHIYWTYLLQIMCLLLMHNWDTDH